MVAPPETAHEPGPGAPAAGTLAAVRRILAIALVVGFLGTGIELLLIGHTESWWQLVPLALIGISVLVLIWCAVGGGVACMRTFQATMLLCVISGGVGTWLHYSGNVEFELEMYPDLEGMDLFGEAMTGATPALAPGTMIGLGLVGLAYAFRHPRAGERT